MECEHFVTWLENRDIHDISEADKAHRHAERCRRCRELLSYDELLDRHITALLARETAPDGLQTRVDRNLDRMQPAKGNKQLWTLVAALSVVLVALVPFRGWLTGQDSERPVLSMVQLTDAILADYRHHGSGGVGFEPVQDAAEWLRVNFHSAQLPPEGIIAGYTVKWARFCYLDDCLAVHMIYEKEGKTLSVFVLERQYVDVGFAGKQLSPLATGGRNIYFSREGEYLYAAIGH